MSTPKALILVAIGGAIGAFFRACIALWIPHVNQTDVPWNTLIVNLLGCLLMGFLMWCAIEVWPNHHWLRPLLGAGVLGGFTTFSAFAGESVLLADGGAWLGAVAYIAITLIGGVLLVRVGVALGKMISRKPASLRSAELGADELTEGL